MQSDGGYFVEVGGALENKLHISDPEKLARIEYDNTAKQISQILQEGSPKHPDFNFFLHLFLASESQRIFTELKNSGYLVGLPKDQFIEKLAWLSSELNALHPFREGNGRSIRLYLMLLSKNAGYLLDFNIVPYEDILTADCAAFAGNFEPLTTLYSKIAQPIDQI